MDWSFKRRSLIPLCFLGAFILAGEQLHAQALLWSGNYGGRYNEGANSGLRTSDGGYMILGSTYSYGAGDHDIYVLRLDSLGKKLWSRTYGGPAADHGYDIQQTNDNNFIIVGATASYGSGSTDIYLLKIDFMGSVIWAKTYGGSLPERGLSVQATPDGGYIVAGFTYSYGSGEGDIYLIKTNALGDSLWSRTYGGSSEELAYAVRAVPSGGYIISGYTQSYGQGFCSIYAVRTDDNGDSLWTKIYGGDKADIGYTVEITPDGGFIFGGATASFGMGYSDCYLVKTGPDGTVDWEQTYGGSLEDRAYSVKVTPDGGYLIAGTTESFGKGQVDIYAVKTDLFGFTEWGQTFGGVNSDFCQAAIPVNKAFVLVGQSYSYSSGGSDVYIVKIHSDQATDVDDDIAQLLPGSFELAQNYPNPFNMSTTIEFDLSARADVTLSIHNVLGQVVRQWHRGILAAGRHSVSWDGYSDYGYELASGVYLYTIHTEQFRQTKKMVLLK